MFPGTCFFPSSTCTSTGSARGPFYSTTNFNNIKMSVIKGQLAAGCVIFVLCIAFIALYIYTVVKVNRAMNSPVVHPILENPLTGPNNTGMVPPMTNIRPHRAGSPLYHRPTIQVDNGDGRGNDLVCPTCSTTMSVTIRKKL